MPSSATLKVALPLPVILPGSVRVRVAPSPTGPLHIGTARTALFNFLFARKYQGTFVLRIEDTDLERSDPLFEKDIIENLRWLGIIWDEGIDVGGEYTPYRQSERMYTYAKYLEQLLASGAVYHCFCTEEQLEQDRQDALASKKPPRYVGRCSGLSDTAVRERHGKGEHSIIRLRIVPQEVSFYDLIRGDITFDAGLLGDIAIAKNNFLPLYNFAAVVDDFEMKMTHVIRGEDHIANTPKQILIGRALHIPSPMFAHVPLVLGPDRSKLSKRHGATTIYELRSAGYYPEALVNFFAMLGWNPGDDKEVFGREELISLFSLERVQKGGAIWNQKKLEWFNAQFSKDPRKRWLQSPQATPELLHRMYEIFASANLIPEFTERHTAMLEGIAKLVLARLNLAQLDEYLVEDFGFFFRMPAYDRSLLMWKSMTRQEVGEQLQQAKKVLNAVPEGEFTAQVLEQVLLAHAQEAGDRGRFLWPLRAALSGKKQSPGPHEIAAILGKSETLARIDAVL